MTRYVRVGICAFLALLALWARDARTAGTWTSSDALAVWVFDIGQGDAIFIDGPERQVLIDGGPSAVVGEKLAAVMPWTDRTLDLVAATHPHADHIVGLIPVLDRYTIARVWDTGQAFAGMEFGAYRTRIEHLTQDVRAGDVLDLGGGAILRIILPAAPFAGARLDDPNTGSFIFLLTYGETTMLLTGDAGLTEEDAVVATLEQWVAQGIIPNTHIDVLKVGHHGSGTASGEALLAAITPDSAAISCGIDNDYGHPHAATLARLAAHHVTVYRTDLHGDIRILTHGGEPTVSFWRL